MYENIYLMIAWLLHEINSFGVHQNTRKLDSLSVLIFIEMYLAKNQTLW